ncbi:RIP metalloprotease RseP [Cryomorpha ignava]|uniref:Zinc metalloprotease n=1 Tax=Cryomorpha ignava TaxID=101383 RepID=A0A7K3WSV6_9FLAO|nr:RIP metalloprotease RseP [Cryomorpha ignava]NEN24141.1 RIP metalloprotease RseP [Cryomorpha ignava]
MDFAIKVTQFFLSISLLVVLHELGHFIPARLFKTRVEKFYLFFDPWFSIFKKKIGDTEYGIGWLPLGGYVKISGMIDESMDTEQLKEPAKPWEFRSKPAWQRLIIMIGGVTVNVILAFFIYAMMLFAWGKEYIPNENLAYGVYADSLMIENGFQEGDKILMVGDHKPETLNEVNQEVLFGDARSIKISRDGKEMDISLPDDIDQQMLASGVQSIFYERYPAVVDSVFPDSYAEKAGLVKNDVIQTINGKQSDSFQGVVSQLRNYKNQNINLGITRNSEPITIDVDVDSLGRLGFMNKSPFDFLETKKQEYTFFESFPAGVEEGTGILVSYVRSLKLIFSSEGVKQVGGFGTIAGLFGDSWNWPRFWNMTALLSIILAVMNILPIPALDGGHVMFLLYEMITGREPNQKFMEYAQLVGIAILLTLLLYANGMDFFRWYNN